MMGLPQVITLQGDADLCRSYQAQQSGPGGAIEFRIIAR
jgi:hypothetical protein